MNVGKRRFLGNRKILKNFWRKQSQETMKFRKKSPIKESNSATVLSLKNFGSLFFRSLICSGWNIWKQWIISVTLWGYVPSASAILWWNISEMDCVCFGRWKGPYLKLSLVFYLLCRLQEEELRQEVN